MIWRRQWRLHVSLCKPSLFRKTLRAWIIFKRTSSANTIWSIIDKGISSLSAACIHSKFLLQVSFSFSSKYSLSAEHKAVDLFGSNEIAPLWWRADGLKIVSKVWARQPNPKRWLHWSSSSASCRQPGKMLFFIQSVYQKSYGSLFLFALIKIIAGEKKNKYNAQISLT